MSLEEFWSSSPYEFACAVHGWNKAQGGEEKPPPMSDEEFDRMVEANAN